MKIVFVLIVATLLGGCATFVEDYPQPNPDNSVRVWGHASGDNWSVSF
jgi:uncharacterized protein YceK